MFKFRSLKEFYVQLKNMIIFERLEFRSNKILF
jgi:hypothetical protein